MCFGDAPWALDASLFVTQEGFRIDLTKSDEILREAATIISMMPPCVAKSKQHSLNEIDGFGCCGSVLVGYSVRDLLTVQGEAGPIHIVFGSRKRLGPNRSFRVKGDSWPEPFVLGSGRGPSA